MNNDDHSTSHKRVHRVTPSAMALLCGLVVWIASPRIIDSALAADAKKKSVAIVYINKTTYLSGVRSLESELKRLGTVSTLFPWPDDESKQNDLLANLRDMQPSVIAVAGRSAAHRVHQEIMHVPIVLLMEINILDSPFVQDGNMVDQRLAAIAANPSPASQLDWITRLDPSVKNLGILYADNTAHTVDAFRHEADKWNVTITHIKTDQENFLGSLEKLTEHDCDGVLMLLEPQIYNRATIERLLLWGVHRQKPVFTFSANMVSAGAMAGMAADTSAAGKQAAGMIQRILTGTPIQEIGFEYPQTLEKYVNQKIADLISVRLDKSILEEAVGE